MVAIYISELVSVFRASSWTTVRWKRINIFHFVETVWNSWTSLFYIKLQSKTFNQYKAHQMCAHIWAVHQTNSSPAVLYNISGLHTTDAYIHTWSGCTIKSTAVCVTPETSQLPVLLQKHVQTWQRHGKQSCLFVQSLLPWLPGHHVLHDTVATWSPPPRVPLLLSFHYHSAWCQCRRWWFCNRGTATWRHTSKSHLITAIITWPKAAWWNRQ